MRNATSAALFLIAAAVMAVASQEPETLTYDVAAVDGKLFLESENESRRLKPGDQAISGDHLRTARSSSATLGVRSHAAVFRLGPKTSCTLAHDRPGLLLRVERGRLRAVFGTLSGAGPRLVTTPSAVLAVRGTEYGLRVKKNGVTRIVVFEGVVEVTDSAGLRPPIRVAAGQQTRVKPGKPVEPPVPHQLSPSDWDNGRTPPSPGMIGSAARPGSPSGSSRPGASRSPGGSKRHGG